MQFVAHNRGVGAWGVDMEMRWCAVSAVALSISDSGCPIWNSCSISDSDNETDIPIR